MKWLCYNTLYICIFNDWQIINILHNVKYPHLLARTQDFQNHWLNNAKNQNSLVLGLGLMLYIIWNSRLQMISCIQRSFDFLQNLYTTHVHHYQCVLQSLSNDMRFNVFPNGDYTQNMKEPCLKHEPFQHPKNNFCGQSLVHKMDINLKSTTMINMIENTFCHNRTPQLGIHDQSLDVV